jgi:glycerol-3-phosphate O-acyltransferase / dihydroxyacetone phosphate acyltransferase
MPDQQTEQGYRHAKEVMAFLRKRGAKIQHLEKGMNSDWVAAVASDTDTPAEERTEDEMRWEPASRH